MASAVARALSRDPEMAALLRRHGPAPIGDRPLFLALVRAVAAQQLSAKAASTILGRVEARIGLEPRALAGARSDRLRRCGLSAAKARTLRELARRALAGELDALQGLGDEDVRERLLAIRGVGPWTVQMVMIFALGRPDVWPTGDAGIQRAALRVYGVSREELEALGERFRPWRSHAAWHLWRALDPAPEG
jgi:DNA-3-methyladenine glycosylase II